MNNFGYKKSLGQNFIKDENITDKIVKYSEVDKDTLVIEIGPGAGSLSKKIVPLSGYSILYEIDERLKPYLNDVLGSFDNYEVIFGDFLVQQINNLSQLDKYKKVYVIANLPYYITTPILVKLTNELYPDKILVMVQEEVANRLSATDGHREYGMISVLLGSRYKIKKLFTVSRNCFIPQPNVDSAVISFDKCDLLGDVSYEKFSNFIKQAFKFKRKNLKNNLNGYNVDMINEILINNGYNISNRAEDIPIEVFIEIVKNL